MSLNFLLFKKICGRTSASLLSVFCLLATLSNCGTETGSPSVKVNLEARLVTLSSSATVTTTNSKAIIRKNHLNSGTIINQIDHYKVVFKKIRVGNSAEDAQVLWESVDPLVGETKDIANASGLVFDRVNNVKAGSYKHMEITIGKTLQIAGSILQDGITYTGEGQITADTDAHLFSLFDGTLANAIEISEGATLVIKFNIEGTLSYESGTSPNAVIKGEKPVISIGLR